MRPQFNGNTKLSSCILVLTFIFLCHSPLFSQLTASLKTSQISTGEELFILYSSKDEVLSQPLFLKRKILFNRDTLLVVQKYYQEKSIDIDSSWLKTSNLNLLKYTAHIPSERKQEHFRFTPWRISGSTFQNGALQKTFDFSDSIYFSAVTDLELVKSLPLKVDRTFKVRLYNPGKFFLSVEYKVVRKEKIALPGGVTVKCYVLEMIGAFVPTTLWIDRQTQSLIVQKVLLKNGDLLIKQRIFP